MNAEKTSSHSNKLVIALIFVAAVGVGALAYLSGQFSYNQKNEISAQQSDQEMDAETEEEFKVEAGNPVVANIDGQEILRNDVIAYIRTLPMQMQQMPAQHIFPAALEQLINETLIKKNAANAQLDNDPTVVKKLAETKKEIIATVYIQKEVEKSMTDDRFQKVYDDYVAGLEKVEETRAVHILVEDEDMANDLIQQLENGADFAALATEHSTDVGSAKQGGDIGFFAKQDVVPEFAEAAFSQKIGEHSFKPVKSDYGYHIIKATERRERPIPSLAEAKPMLEAGIRQQILRELFDTLRKESKINVFDINGKAK